MSRKNVLVVDFDYFFRNPMEAADGTDPNVFLYDWGHKEAPIFVEGPLWNIRAEQFMETGLPLPRTSLVPGWWSRFRFAQNVELLLCDSNAHAGNLTPEAVGGNLGEVWLFDAHHDSGYRDNPTASMKYWRSHYGTLNCEDWMIDLASDGADLHMRYPQWRENGLEMEPEPAVTMDRQVDDLAPLPIRFHAVLMCRSGAWVPPWCDDDFTTLAEQFPGKHRWLDETHHPRDWQVDSAEIRAARVAALDAMRAGL